MIARFPTLRRARVLEVGLLLALTAPGCESNAPTPHDLEVEVRAEGGAPVSGAQLHVRGDYLGTTDSLGHAALRVPARAGERLPVSLTCPPGFSTAPAEQVVAVPERTPSALAQRLTLICQTEQHDAVVVVHAAGTPASLPILVDGVPVGQTDSLGFAHVHVRAAADSPFDVSLDTSANAKLSPSNPSRRFQLEGRDEVFVFDAAFDAPRPTKQRRGKRRSRGT